MISSQALLLPEAKLVAECKNNSFLDHTISKIQKIIAIPDANGRIYTITLDAAGKMKTYRQNIYNNLVLEQFDLLGINTPHSLIESINAFNVIDNEWEVYLVAFNSQSNVDCIYRLYFNESFELIFDNIPVYQHEFQGSIAKYEIIRSSFKDYYLIVYSSDEIVFLYVSGDNNSVKEVFSYHIDRYSLSSKYDFSVYSSEKNNFISNDSFIFACYLTNDNVNDGIGDKVTLFNINSDGSHIIAIIEGSSYLLYGFPDIKVVPFNNGKECLVLLQNNYVSYSFVYSQLDGSFNPIESTSLYSVSNGFNPILYVTNLSSEIVFFDADATWLCFYDDTKFELQSAVEYGRKGGVLLYRIENDNTISLYLGEVDKIQDNSLVFNAFYDPRPSLIEYNLIQFNEVYLNPSLAYYKNSSPAIIQNRTLGEQYFTQNFSGWNAVAYPAYREYNSRFFQTNSNIYISNETNQIFFPIQYIFSYFSSSSIATAVKMNHLSNIYILDNGSSNSSLQRGAAVCYTIDCTSRIKYWIVITESYVNANFESVIRVYNDENNL